MAAEEYLDVFPGAKRSGNTHAVLSQRATPENIQILTAPGVAEITEPEAVLASRLQPAWGCARETASPAAHSSRNGLIAI